MMVQMNVIEKSIITTEKAYAVKEFHDTNSIAIVNKSVYV